MYLGVRNLHLLSIPGSRSSRVHHRIGSPRVADAGPIGEAILVANAVEHPSVLRP